MHSLLSFALCSIIVASPVTATASPVAFQVRQDTMARDSAQRLGRVVVKERATKASGYTTSRTTTATKTDTPLRDTPQAVSIVGRQLIADQAMQNMADVVRYVPSITMGQGEGHRDAPTIRGNSSTADFFVDGVRDDAQYYRDLYNVERVEALKGSNAMIFGRGGGGGIINRVSKDAGFAPIRAFTLEGGSFDHKRGTVDVNEPITSRVAARFNGMYENSGGFRDAANLERSGLNPTLSIAAGANTSVRLGYEYFRDHRNVDRGIPSFKDAPSGAPLETFFGDPDVSYADARVHSGGATIDHSTAAGLTIRNRSRFTHYDKFYQNVFPGGAVNAAGTQVNLSGYNNAQARANLFNQTDVTYALETGSDRVRASRVQSERDRRQQPRRRERQRDLRAESDRAVAAVAGDCRPSLRAIRSPLPQQPEWPGSRSRRSHAVATARARVQAARGSLHVRELQHVAPAKLRGSVLIVDGDDGDAGAGSIQELRARCEVGCASGSRRCGCCVPARSVEQHVARP